MDFTPELVSFQGIIMAADHKFVFSRVTSRGGNEETIQKIIESLHKYFLEKKYYTSEGIAEKGKSEMRKLSFYLVLNSEFPALEEIVELPNVGHLVWTTPTITSCLFCELVWSLGMDCYVGEVISYCSPKLSVQILKALVNGVRYCSAQDSVDKLCVMAVASYRCLCRLSFFNYDNSHMSALLSDIFTCFLRSITHFVSPPNNGKLEELPDDDRHLHLGKAFRALLESTLTCLSLFKSPLEFASDSFDDVYLTTFNPASVKTRSLPKSVGESSDPAVLEYLCKCNVAALDKCVELVMRVSVDVFCCWSEYTEDGRSMQRIVGELCHRLLHELQGMSDLSQHTLMSMLPQLSCKPVDIFDVIREANDDALIANAQSNGTEREHWLNAIVERSNLYESEPFMTCLLKHLTFMKPEACETLFKRSIAYLQQNNYENDSAKLLAADSFIGVDSAKKSDLISEIYSHGVYHDSLETPGFDNKLIETFNKLISTSDADLSEIYDVFLQNPYAVYEKILNVGVESVKQANLMVSAIVMLKSFLEHRCDGEKEPAILNAIEGLCAVTLETEIQENSFVCLLSGLSRSIAVLQNPLLVRIIMPYVHKSVVNKDFRTLKLHLRLVSEGYDTEELVRYRAPLLAMLAQVLEAVRWNFTSYSAEAPTTLQEAINLQSSLFSTYNSLIPEKDANWLKMKLKKLKPLNMYYFKEIWNPPGKNFLQVITNAEIIEEYPILLAKILNCCTQKEWLLLWQSLVMERDEASALELMYQSLITMTLTETKHRSDSSRGCIQYCYRCFTSVVKEHFLTDPSNEGRVKDVLDKFVGLANITCDEDIDDIGAILLPLLASLTGTKRPADDVSYLEITNKLNHGKFAKLVQDVFANAAM